MTAAEQHREWGVCVDASEGHVVVQVGREIRAVSVHDAHQLAFHLVNAYCRAAGEMPLGRFREVAA